MGPALSIEEEAQERLDLGLREYRVKKAMEILKRIEMYETKIEDLKMDLAAAEESTPQEGECYCYDGAKISPFLGGMVSSC